MFKVQKAQRIACRASIMLEGLPGTGKTGNALIIARGLVKNWDEVGCIDTENNSANLFVGINASSGGKFDPFLFGDLNADIGFKPTNYLAYRDALISAGAKSVIFDSISHAWNYKGGVLDQVATAKTKNAHYAKDKYAAWGDEDVIKEKNQLLEMIRDRRAHMITTVRVKEKMEYTQGDKGLELKSLGEQQIQQADLKYEPDLVLHTLSPGAVAPNGMIIHPKVRVVKTRYAILAKDQEYELTPELIEQIRTYLEEGADPEELLKQQQTEYVQAVTEYLDTHPNAVAIWKVFKEEAGFKDTKLKEIPLDVLKQLFIKLTVD